MGLFLVEAFVITYQLRWGRLVSQPDSLWLSIAEHVPALIQVLLVATATSLVLGWRRLRAEWHKHSASIRPWSFPWPFFFTHLTFLGGYLTLTAWLLSGEATNSSLGFAWAFLGLAALAFLGLSSLPAAVWLKLARRGWLICLASIVVGLVAFYCGELTLSWWRPLSDATLWLVRVLLSVVTADVIYQPDEFLIGTANYAVTVGAPCSGYEGIGLVWIFLSTTWPYAGTPCVFRRHWC